MNPNIYLDNNATTKCDEEVLQAMLPYLKEEYGNPSSIYSFGSEIKEEIKKARRNLATLLGAKEDEIIFTSGASESNTTAIFSAVRNYPTKRHIITTSVEHASIMEAMKYLESIGYQITYLSVDEKGRIDLEELRNSITEDTFLITIMMANNEIGNIYPIEEIGKIAEKYHILFHCDAVQAVGKMKIEVEKLKVSTLSLSGHKINAPKGIGVLYVKEKIPFTPLIFGHQEGNRRGGTENVAFIIGLGKAAEQIMIDDFQSVSKIQELRDYMERQIKEKISDIKIYGDTNNRLANISSMAFKNVKADELLVMLESFHIFISTGSACNSEIAEPSHVLVSCKANLEEYSPIRISLGKDNTKEEIDIFIKRLENVVAMLRRK